MNWLMTNYVIKFWFVLYVNNMFVFNETYYYKTYMDHPRIDHDSYKLLNLESNETIESWDEKFWEPYHKGYGIWDYHK